MQKVESFGTVHPKNRVRVCWKSGIRMDLALKEGFLKKDGVVVDHGCF